MGWSPKVRFFIFFSDKKFFSLFFVIWREEKCENKEKVTEWIPFNPRATISIRAVWAKHKFPGHIYQHLPHLHLYREFPWTFVMILKLVIIRVILAPNDLLTPFDLRAQNFRVNVEFANYHRGQKIFSKKCPKVTFWLEKIFCQVFLKPSVSYHRRPKKSRKFSFEP